MKLISRGFTLIELLVVISIVALLSSIVLASLATTKTKSSDTGIKLSLINARAQASLMYNTYGHFDVDSSFTAFTEGACLNTSGTLFADSIIWAQISSAKSSAGSGSFASCVTSNTVSPGRWAVAVQMRTANAAWCVDSGGVSKQYNLGAAATQALLDGVISNTTFNCN